MKRLIWAGIALIILGALALAFQGITYTRQKDVVDLGSVHLTAESRERIPIPPVLGGLAVGGGIVLVIMGAKRKS